MLVNDLYQYVIDMLSGTHESCKRIQLFQKPSKEFIIGSLADTSKNYAVGTPTGENKIQSKSALRHNSMSVFFLINKDVREKIKILPYCDIFYKVFPTYEEQKQYLDNIKEDKERLKDPGFREYYKRKPCSFQPFEIDLENGDKYLIFDEYIDEIIEDKNTYRLHSEISKELKEKDIKENFDPEWIESKEIYVKILEKITENKPRRIFKWSARIVIERESYDASLDLISIRFINMTTKEKKETAKYEMFLFNCQLKVFLNTIKVFPFEYKYQYEGYNYVQTGDLRTLNCHADYDKHDNIIITRPYGYFEQIKKVPRSSINGIVASFKDLKQDLNILENLLVELKKQYSKYTSHPIYLNSDHQFHIQFVNETDSFSRILERYELGLKILQANEDAKKSFHLMNKVFELSTKGQYDCWRLFQIVFIVMVIPDIVNTSLNRDFADIIHVDTGGGKSEAYFGLVVFLLFWDRLRDKNLGVSAITKFPLRMLSIQQLQRVSKIIVIAEKIRKEENIGEEPFSVGYYIGISDDFPRHTYDKIQFIKKSKDKGERVPGILLDRCPHCSSPIFLDYEDSKHRIFHFCEKCDEKYYLYYTNSEIYRFLPSFIVSTVDKLASVALNRRFKNILGGKLSYCKENHGFTPVNDACEVKEAPRRSCKAETKVLGSVNEGPTLMIQDELHLLREGFGTIDSHFESLLNVLLKKLSNKEFKYISMTATVSGAREQIDNLYGKDYFIFPSKLPRGLDEDEDFFFGVEKDDHQNPQIQRILIGLKPNLRDNQYASLLTIHHISNFIKDIKTNLVNIANKYKITPEELKDELKKYQCILTYHGKKSDVWGMNYFLHTVVTSKLKEFEITNKTLTGDNSLEEIKDAINQIEDFPEVKENFNKLHSTFATNIVSHGVDIDNWNIMIFQGMTRDTAEYIQALSRAGRKYLGLTFLWFYPNRVRDLSYYKNFKLFHSILQHKVERTPISRWTRLGFKQTFTSLFCAGILNYISDQEEKPLYTLDAVNQHFDSITNRRELVEFLKDAYYTEEMKDRVGSGWFHNNIANETEERLNKLKGTVRSSNKNFFPNVLKETEDPYYKTQYGMRGIQEQITLKLDVDFAGLLKKYNKGG